MRIILSLCGMKLGLCYCLIYGSNCPLLYADMRRTPCEVRVGHVSFLLLFNKEITCVKLSNNSSGGSHVAQGWAWWFFHASLVLIGKTVIPIGLGIFNDIRNNITLL